MCYSDYEDGAESEFSGIFARLDEAGLKTFMERAASMRITQRRAHDASLIDGIGQDAATKLEAVSVANGAAADETVLHAQQIYDRFIQEIVCAASAIVEERTGFRFTTPVGKSSARPNSNYTG